MSAFLGGFAKSLSGSISKQYEADQDEKRWEERQKKVMELEKMRITQLIPIPGKNGELMMQPANAAGEPIGPPRPANAGEKKAYDNGETERTLKFDQMKATTESEKEQGANSRAQRENIPIENRFRQSQLDISASQAASNNAVNQAQVGYYGAQTANTQETTRGNKLVNDRLASDPAALQLKLAGGRGGAATEKPPTVTEQLKIKQEIESTLQELGPLTDEEKATLSRVPQGTMAYLDRLAFIKANRNVDTVKENTVKSGSLVDSILGIP